MIRAMVISSVLTHFRWHWKEIQENSIAIAFVGIVGVFSFFIFLSFEARILISRDGTNMNNKMMKSIFSEASSPLNSFRFTSIH